ncbi:hypothetical protein BV20DRAFT_1078320 [Pilatotrama ljubarskyi]|nr:hypothetical protein BV20DRAFT_1078320 [Pilatotrama ljubarskyi]
MTLDRLDDDTLLHIFTFLPAPSILCLRKTCRRFEMLSKQRIVWQNVCIDQVLREGYPFPHRDAVDADASILERLVLRALRLGRFWLSGAAQPRCSLDFKASSGTGVSHVRFLPGHGGRYIVTVYKGIWSMISCWDVGCLAERPRAAEPRKLADWCPKSTIFSGFVVNSSLDSGATLAVAVQTGGGQRSIEILSVTGCGSGNASFKSICNIATSFRPIALQGDLIAFSDDAYETVVMNWRENTFAVLKGSQQPMDERFQYNRCLQIVFAYKSILVVRARSVELFPEPDLLSAEESYMTYEPFEYHTFGWIDGVSVNKQHDPLLGVDDDSASIKSAALSILLRTESDDPWASDVHKLEQFLLLPNPAFTDHARPPDSPTGGSAEDSTSATASVPPMAPYIFPPVRAEHASPAVRGFLRCTDIILGPCGTALWIQPRAARTAHLTGLDVHSSAAQVFDSLNPDHLHPDEAPPTPLAAPGGVRAESADRAKTAESLCAAVFAGPLQRRHPELLPHPRKLWVQPRDNCNWTAVDYDEDRGRVALGSSDGTVAVLDLV